MKTTVIQYKKKIQALKKRGSTDSAAGAATLSIDLEDPTGAAGTKFPNI
jgi:hypothetical protein